MKALQLIEQGAPGKFKLLELPDPKPGPEDVVVRVHSCGVNHIDLWLEEGGLPVSIPLPRIPGGEVAGTVVGFGTSVTDWKTGDRGAIQSTLFCGHCEFCGRGEESNCLNG